MWRETAICVTAVYLNGSKKAESVRIGQERVSAENPCSFGTFQQLRGAARTAVFGFDSRWRYHKPLFAAGADGVAAVNAGTGRGVVS